jgi:hypothetical protein
MTQSTQALTFRADSKVAAIWPGVDERGLLVTSNQSGTARTIRGQVEAELRKRGCDKEEDGIEIQITGTLVGNQKGAETVKGLRERMQGINFVKTMPRNGLKTTLHGWQSLVGYLTWLMPLRRPTLNLATAEGHLRHARPTGFGVIYRRGFTKALFDDEMLTQERGPAPALREAWRPRMPETGVRSLARSRRTWGKETLNAIDKLAALAAL